MNDFLLTDDNDLQVDTVTGSFKTGPGEEQEVEAILMSDKGDWKQTPPIGLGLTRSIEGDFDRRKTDKLKRDAALQLTADGFKVNGIEILLGNGEILSITPNVERG